MWYVCVYKGNLFSLSLYEFIYIYVWSYMCGCIGTCVTIHVEARSLMKARSLVGIFPYCSPSYKAESLTGSHLHMPRLRLQAACHTYQSLLWILEVQTQVLMLSWQGYVATFQACCLSFRVSWWRFLFYLKKCLSFRVLNIYLIEIIQLYRQKKISNFQIWWCMTLILLLEIQRQRNLSLRPDCSG